MPLATVLHLGMECALLNVPDIFSVCHAVYRTVQTVTNVDGLLCQAYREYSRHFTVLFCAQPTTEAVGGVLGGLGGLGVVGLAVLGPGVVGRSVVAAGAVVELK